MKRLPVCEPGMFRPVPLPSGGVAYIHVEVEYSYTERRRTTHKGFVVKDDPENEWIEFIFFHTENRIRGGKPRRLSFVKLVRRRDIRRISVLEPTTEELDEVNRGLEARIKKEVNVDKQIRMRYFDLETQITDKTSDVYFSRIMRVRDEKTRRAIIKSIHETRKRWDEFAAKFDDAEKCITRDPSSKEPT